ncbi:hypothetical protein M9H77_22884 [Catharanthus roseus]|uniref:Uncharacterized protein n=1 Tax=Catharanthus roseus TaxID=4058 RepID=A0ACC0ASG5_CATRO|nr:hypothetical protein M9H77_22884 [Catharanthus roseus]
MHSSSSSSVVKVVLQSIDGKIFKVDKAVAKKSVTIEHWTENRLTSLGLFVSLMFLATYLQRSLSNANYLDINGILSLACEDILDMIKRKDPSTSVGISTSCRIFPQKGRKICEWRICGLLTKSLLFVDILCLLV